MTFKPRVLNLQVKNHVFHYFCYLKVTPGLRFPVKIKQEVSSCLAHPYVCPDYALCENTKPQTLWPWSWRGDCLVLLRLWSADQTKIRLLLSGSVTLEKSIIYLCPHSPAVKGRGCSFPCCRGTLGIKLLSETDGEYGKCACGSGSQPTPQCQIFLTTHGPDDPPEHDPCFQTIAAGLSTPSRAHLVSSCFGKCPHLLPYCVGLLAQRWLLHGVLLSPRVLLSPLQDSEGACSAWLSWSFW